MNSYNTAAIKKIDVKGPVVNGVPTGQLMEVISSIQQDADNAQFQFRLNNRWMGGSINRSRMDDLFADGREDRHEQAFELDADEPRLIARQGERVEGDPASHPVWRDEETAITATKNYPAIIVNGDLTVENAATVSIEGLVCAHSMTVAADADNITILGALFLRDTGINQDPLYSGDITVTTAPMISSVNLIPASAPDIKWSPAGDAFFKYIRRNPAP